MVSRSMLGRRARGAPGTSITSNGPSILHPLRVRISFAHGRHDAPEHRSGGRSVSVRWSGTSYRSSGGRVGCSNVEVSRRDAVAGQMRMPWRGRLVTSRPKVNSITGPRRKHDVPSRSARCWPRPTQVGPGNAVQRLRCGLLPPRLPSLLLLCRQQRRSWRVPRRRHLHHQRRPHSRVARRGDRVHR